MSSASFGPQRVRPSLPAKRQVPVADFSFLQVYSESPSDGLYLKARFGDGDIGTTGGGGGWQSAQRPQRQVATVWRGAADGYAHTVPLVIDGLVEGRSVEGECRALERMVGVNSPEYEQPPLLILNANGALANDVYHTPAWRWIIPEPPQYGAQIRRRVDGVRVRQFVTVKFQVYTPYDSLTRAVPHVGSNRQVIAKPGDTYKKIAARSLKSSGGIRWANRLAQLNGARDGAAKLRPGQVVKLPTVAQLKLWERTPRR